MTKFAPQIIDGVLGPPRSTVEVSKYHLVNRVSADVGDLQDLLLGAGVQRHDFGGVSLKNFKIFRLSLKLIETDFWALGKICALQALLGLQGVLCPSGFAF